VNILKKPFSKDADILYSMQSIKTNYLQFKKILENFNNMKIAIENILESLLIDNKLEMIQKIEEIIKTNLSAENIFEFLNKEILEYNFKVSFNEIDMIYKHSCFILNEGLKTKNQDINYILREDDFISNLNENIYCNPIDVTSEHDLPNRILYPPDLEIND